VPSASTNLSSTPLRILAAAILLLAAGCATVAAPSRGAEEQPAAGAVTVSMPQVVSGVDDPLNGPCIKVLHGCIALNPDVSQDTLKQTICVSGYTKSIRPASSYTQAVKKRLLRDAGLDETQAKDFELDHVVPLALGGHPRKLSNLALQPRQGERGAKIKDALEVRLQRLVCEGQIALIDAQTCIAEDWERCKARYPED